MKTYMMKTYMMKTYIFNENYLKTYTASPSDCSVRDV